MNKFYKRATSTIKKNYLLLAITLLLLSVASYGMFFFVPPQQYYLVIDDFNGLTLKMGSPPPLPYYQKRSSLFAHMDDYHRIPISMENTKVWAYGKARYRGNGAESSLGFYNDSDDDLHVNLQILENCKDADEALLKATPSNKNTTPIILNNQNALTLYGVAQELNLMNKSKGSLSTPKGDVLIRDGGVLIVGATKKGYQITATKGKFSTSIGSADTVILTAHPAILDAFEQSDKFEPHNIKRAHLNLEGPEKIESFWNSESSGAGDCRPFPIKTDAPTILTNNNIGIADFFVLRMASNEESVISFPLPMIFFELNKQGLLAAIENGLFIDQAKITAMNGRIKIGKAPTDLKAENVHITTDQSSIYTDKEGHLIIEGTATSITINNQEFIVPFWRNLALGDILTILGSSFLSFLFIEWRKRLK